MIYRPFLIIFCRTGADIEKKRVQFEKRNPDPVHFRSTIQTAFPRLAGREFRLFRMERNKTELIALSDDVNNVVTLWQQDELNRSHLYVKPLVGRSF